MSFNEEAGTKNPGEIGKLASEKWKALSDADKEPFIVSPLIPITPDVDQGLLIKTGQSP